MPAPTRELVGLPRLPRYKFAEALGSGGVGTVYRAFDRQLQRDVAIKVLRCQGSENPTIHQRFVQEFHAATQLEHPNIVRALDIGTDGRISYLVYELVEGCSLAERVDKQGPLTEDEAVRIITQIAQALHYAHLRQVIHRDVKPDNILVLPDGRAKLTDFGLAKDFNNDQDLTRHASGLGTPHYMAPEQFADAKNVGPAADVYSLAATLYSAVTGRIPFVAKTPFAILVKKERDIPSARAVVPTVSEQLDQAIRQALHPVASQRPPSCLEFFKRLTSRSRFDDGTSDDLPTNSAMPVVVHERRAWIRYPVAWGSYGVVDPCVLGGAVELEEFWPLVIRDLSRGGVGLLLARRFEVGTELSIELSTGLELPPRRLAVKVVRVVPETAGHWIHGCMFLHPLGDNEWNDLVKYTAEVAGEASGGR